MGKALVIAEKYLAACDIANVLKCTEKREGYIEGENYIITWADGHLIGYQYPEEYNPEYKEWKLEQLPLEFNPEAALTVLPEKEKQYEIVKKLIQGPETDMIINAGDAGREGYLIQNRIYRLTENKKPVKVLWTSSLTEEAILEAFSNLHEDCEFKSILEEAEARAENDYILGMNYSRLLTLKCSNDVTLPYGRCMTTLMNLIVQREKEIAEFYPSKSYTIELEYEAGFKGEIVDLEGKSLVVEDEYMAKSIIEEIGKDAEGVVELIKEEKTKERAPYLFSLPELQSVIGSKYKYTPAQTLQIAQTLYEKYKIISYPRTDSEYLPLSMMETVTKNLECCKFGKFKAALERGKKETLEADGKYFNDKDIKDHHALIPTINKRIPEIYAGLKEEEKNVFDEIVYRFLGIFCRERITKSLSVQIFVNGYLFRTTKSTEMDPGYKLLRKAEEKEETANPVFDSLKPGVKLPVASMQIKERVSNPPSRYTVGTIIDLMQKYKIGTPATMAATIEKLLDEKRPFLVLQNGKYYSTPFGRMYVSVIPEPLKQPELTEQMEWKLQQIREGNFSKKEMITETMNELRENLAFPDYKRMSFQRSLKTKNVARANYKKKRRTYLE